MDLAAIRLRTKRQFGDEAGAQITNTDIDAWANDALVDIVRKTEVLQGESTIDTVAGTKGYSLPTNFMLARRVTYDGIFIVKTSIEELDHYSRDRDNTDSEGTPGKYYIWGDKINLYPIPSDSLVAGLNIQYVKKPTTLVLATDIPEIPTQMHEDIVRYCLIRAKELNEDVEQAAIMQNDYDERIGKSSSESFWPYVDSYPAVRALPGDDY